jgi:hypothetical protein
MGHERKHAEARYSRLAAVQAGKRAIGTLLPGEPLERAIDGRVDALPLHR